MSELVAVDVGNSFAKWACFDDDRLAAFGRVPVDRLLSDLWANVAASAGTGPVWAVASVNPHASDPFCQHLQDERGVTVLRIGHDVPVPIRNETHQPDQVGVDRLLGAVAARARAGADRSAVVVDVGSAVTIDCVSPGGAFVGGMIAPGPDMAARALNEFTSQLPHVEPAPVEQVIGKNTEEAIRSGLHHGAVGLVTVALEAVIEELGGDPLVLATGGAAEPVAQAAAKRLGRPIPVIPHLTLEGIRLSVLAHSS